MKLFGGWLVAILVGTLPTTARSNPADSIAAAPAPADSIRILLSWGPVDWSAVRAEHRRLLYMDRKDVPAYPEGGAPTSRWRSDSTLAERSYVTAEKWESWAYDSTGVLIHYEFVLRRSGRLLGSRVSVWFSREGSLIACAVDGDAYWMGRRGTVGEMFDYLAAYYRWPKLR